MATGPRLSRSYWLLAIWNTIPVMTPWWGGHDHIWSFLRQRSRHVFSTFVLQYRPFSLFNLNGHSLYVLCNCYKFRTDNTGHNADIEGGKTRSAPLQEAAEWGQVHSGDSQGSSYRRSMEWLFLLSVMKCYKQTNKQSIRLAETYKVLHTQVFRLPWLVPSSECGLCWASAWACCLHGACAGVGQGQGLVPSWPEWTH